MSYPSEHLTFKGLIKQSFNHYGKAFTASLLFVLLAVIVQDLSYYLGMGSFGPVAHLLTFIGISIVALYFWSCAILASDRKIKGNSLSVGCAFFITLKKIVNVISIAGFYAILFIASTYWMHFLISFGAAHKLSPNMQSFLNLGLAGVPLLVLFLGLMFTIPRLLTSDDALFAAIKHSFIITWQHRFKLSLAVYFSLMVLVYAVSPATRHSAWFAAHHIKLPADALILIILAPVVINFMLFSLNNPAPPVAVKSQKPAAE